MLDFETHKKNFFDFVDRITKDDKVGIIAHANCPDGMSSVVFMNEILKKKGIDNTLIYFCKYGIGSLKEIEDKLSEGGINKVFILDLNADADLFEELVSMQKKFDTLFIDHHPLGERLQINNKVIKTAGTDCTSLVLFRLGEGIIDHDEWVWLACVAAISEFSYKSRENLEFIHKYYPDFNPENAKASKIFEMVKKIGSLNAYYSNNSLKAYDLILKKDFDSIDKISAEVNVEFEKSLEDFEKNAQKHFDGQLYFYFFKSKFSVGSSLGTTLSVKYKGSTIIIFSDIENTDLLKASARNNGIPLKYSMNEMLKAGISGFESAIAGGHAPASGASFLKKDLNRFKQNILEFVGNRLGVK